MWFLKCVPGPKGHLLRYINGKNVFHLIKKTPLKRFNWCKICVKFNLFNLEIAISYSTKWLVLLKIVKRWSIILNNIEQGVRNKISINFVFSLIEAISRKCMVLKNDAWLGREITWPCKEGGYYLRGAKSIKRWPFLPHQPQLDHRNRLQCMGKHV